MKYSRNVQGVMALALGLVLLGLMLAPSISYAAFGVAPSVMELSGARGEVIESKFTLVNTYSVEQEYFFRTAAFEQGGDGGEPRFIPAERDLSGFPGWLSFPYASLKVAAQSKLEVPFQIVVPSGVPSGSYHGAIIVSTTPSDVVASNGVGISASMAALVFVTVEGETVAKAALLDFVPGKTSRWFERPSVDFVFRMQNQGNVYIVPQGRVVLTDLFGRTLSSADANQDDGRILPGTTRTYRGSLSTRKSFIIGPVTARLNLQADENVQMQTAEIRFWSVSWESFLLVLVVFLFIGVLIRRMRRS